MKPQEIIDRSIIAKALCLREGQIKEISTGSSKYFIRIYKNKQCKFVLSLISFLNKKKKVIGYYLSEQIDEELAVDYPKSDYSIYTYEDIQEMIKKNKTSNKIISEKDTSNKNILEPIKEDDSKLIQSLKRELNIIDLKIQKEELLKRIEDAS